MDVGLQFLLTNRTIRLIGFAQCIFAYPLAYRFTVGLFGHSWHGEFVGNIVVSLMGMICFTSFGRRVDECQSVQLMESQFAALGIILLIINTSQ